MLTRKQKENEEGFIQKLFERVKEISFYSYMLSMLIAVLLVICFRIYLDAQKDKKNSAIKKTQTVVQTQIVPKEQFVKNEEISMNGTSRLNESNFEVFVSKKVPNKGIIILKSTDFIKNNNKVILYKAVKTVTISGNPEIIEKLNFNISNNSNINFKKNTIQIELDSNRHDNSILNLQINPELLTKDSIINDETLLTIEYVESYVE